MAFFGGLAIFVTLPNEFFPKFDAGEFQINMKTAPDASLEETRGRLAAVLTAFKQIPEIKHTYATIGAGDTGTVRDVGFYVKLKEKKERRRNQEQVQEAVRKALKDIPGILPSILEAGRMDDRKPLLVSIRGDDLGLLKKYAAELKRRMYAIPGIVDLEVTLEQDIPEYRLIVDRERAVDVGVNTGQIVRTLGALVGGQAVTTYEDEDGDAVNVRVRLPLTLREDVSQVERLGLSVQKAGGGAGPDSSGGPRPLRPADHTLGNRPTRPFSAGGDFIQPGSAAFGNGRPDGEGGHSRA